MKMIHTSDWHLGHRLYNYDRTDEEEHFFRQLTAVVARERPDALAVSGDIFHTGAPGNDVARRFTERLLEVRLACPAMATVIIAGNHDSYSRLVVDEALWRRFRVRVFGTPAEDGEGRADFAKNVVPIPDVGVIAAVPFCHPRNFPSVEGASGENRQGDYFDGLAKFVADRSGGLPAVLLAHLAVKGDLDLRGHEKTFLIGGEECVDAAALGPAYDYVALGHIHCPQWVKGGKRNVRYCGAPRAVHFDEACAHGVDVVTVEAGKPPEVRTETLEPLHELVTLGGGKGLAFDDVLERVAEAELPPDTYVRLNVRLEAGESPGPDWTERARKACFAKSLRFCAVNPVRTEPSGRRCAKKMLTTEELRRLSDDQVLQILAAKHTLSERQRALIKSLMEEAPA